MIREGRPIASHPALHGARAAVRSEAMARDPRPEMPQAVGDRGRSREGDPPRGRLGEAVEMAALRAGVALVGTLPHARATALGAALGAAWGEAARRLRTRRHRIAELNLEIAFPEMSAAARDGIRRAMWRNWGRVLADVARLPRLDAEGLRDIVRLDRREGAVEIFRRARDGGSIVLTAHFGSFELLHAGCAAHGFPITLVHRTLPNRRADQWLTDLRERCGSRVLRRGAAARDILRELRSGRVVALPFDQRPPAGSAGFAPFFSLPPATNSAVARLALASGAPVFPVVLVREGASHRHRAVFGDAIEPARTGDRDADVLENTRRFNAALEALVRAHP